MLVIQRPTGQASSERRGTGEVRRQPPRAGFGHTLGNSLRRPALVHPGAAITQVRFDDALHEFDTIAGVTEDVTDVILNLKDLVMICHSTEPVTLRLDVNGPADVTASSAQPPTPGWRSSTGPAPRRGQRTAGPPRHRHHRRAGPRLRLGRPQQDVVDHRRDPRRLHLLARAPGELRRCRRPASSTTPPTTASSSTSSPTARSPP